MVVLATVATIIAAKSVISGAFSVTRQAIQLGLVAARSLWHKPGWLVAVGGAVFLTAEVSFFLANLSKIAHGGWVPLLVAAVVFTILMTWKRGRLIVTRNRNEDEGALPDFLESPHTMDPPVQRVTGTAVFLHASADTTPLALRANVEHNHVLQQRVIILNIQVENIHACPNGNEQHASLAEAALPRHQSHLRESDRVFRPTPRTLDQHGRTEPALKPGATSMPLMVTDRLDFVCVARRTVHPDRASALTRRTGG